MRPLRVGRWGLGLVGVVAMVSVAVAGPVAGHLATAGDPGAPTWTTHLRILDEALAQKDLGAAKRAWREAYLAAVGSWHWAGLVQVGDAALRMGEVVGARQAFEAQARNVYAAALARARQQESLEGVLRLAEAFAEVGDRAAVAQCLRIAERLAAQDPEAQADVRAVAARLADERVPAGGFRP